MATDKNPSPQQAAKDANKTEKAEPSRHPAQPHPAEPGVPQGDTQPRRSTPQTKDEPEEKVLGKDEAKALFLAGHRLRRKGSPPDKWIAATRLNGVLVLCVPIDEETEKKVLGEDLVLADAPPAQA